MASESYYEHVDEAFNKSLRNNFSLFRWYNNQVKLSFEASFNKMYEEIKFYYQDQIKQSKTQFSQIQQENDRRENIRNDKRKTVTSIIIDSFIDRL